MRRMVGLSRTVIGSRRAGVCSHRSRAIGNADVLRCDAVAPRVQVVTRLTYAHLGRAAEIGQTDGGDVAAASGERVRRAREVAAVLKVSSQRQAADDVVPLLE